MIIVTIESYDLFSMLFVTVLNVIFATLCYLYYGDDVKDNIISDLEKGMQNAHTNFIKIYNNVKHVHIRGGIDSC
jgi:hypothetical protein